MAIAAGGAWWALRTEPGTARVLALLPGVEVETPKGSLLGDFEARRLAIRLPASQDRIEIAELVSRGLRIERASGPAWLRIVSDELRARRVDVKLAPGPAKSEPLQPPRDLAPPVELDLRALRVGELFVSSLGTTPLRELQAHVQLGAQAGGLHRVDNLRVAWDRLQLEGRAQIASRAPLALEVQVAARQDAEQARALGLPAWNAQATLAGPLTEPALQATLRANAQPGREAQSLDARATLHPFAAWPLGELRATLHALDLAAFASAAPSTALSGDASAASRGVDQPANLKLTLANALPGRWNEARLPLASIALELAAVPNDPSTLELTTFDAQLASADPGAAATPASVAGPAGRITGRGRWTRERWNLDAVLTELQPSRLDARAPAMQLSGPLRLSGSGFGGGPSQLPTLDVQTELQGRLADRGPARAAVLKLDGSANERRLELRSAEASAGAARATLSGSAERGTAADAPWAVKANARLVDFDPAPWWPGWADSPARRRTTSRLNATAQVDLQVPSTAAPGPAAAPWLATLRGQADIVIANGSLLAGVPLAGETHLKNSDGTQLVAALKLDAGGNALRVDGRFATRGTGANDAWTVQLDGPALDRLAPLLALAQPAGADARLAGRLNVNAQIAGRWPSVTTQGQLAASGLRVGTARLDNAQGQWQAGSAADAPLTAQLAVSQLALVAADGAPGPSLESAQLQLKGSARAHTLELRAQSKALPPAWTDSLQSAAPPGTAGATTAATTAGTARTQALLQAHGGLLSRSAAAGAVPTGWGGAVDRVELRSTGYAPMLQAQNVAFEIGWGPSGPARALVQPGRAEILGGALRWSRIAWQGSASPGAPAQIDADAELEPMRIAPLLARAQPDFGWGGDLTVAGTLAVHSAPSFKADVVIERRSGDLTVTEELGTQALGLTDLRLGLAASDGVWSFTQALAGKTLGVAAGAIVARTTPQATWPGADTPIEGVLELQVASLGTWGPWVPPGWRLDGRVHASASIGGRFGAPQYTGQVLGSQISVRNFLQGVDVHDGDVAIRLQGESARIERFTAKAGNGSVKLDGDAELGEAPKATLRLIAERFQLLGRVDRRIVASGQAQLRLDRQALALDGKFDVDEGLIDFTRSDAPTLASDVQVIRPGQAPSPAAAASAAASPRGAAPVVAPPTSRDVALDLRVGLGEKLRVRGRGLDTGLRGELHITSPGGRLAVNGTVQAVDGTYAAYSQKLAIDRGQITFNGPVDTPRLDIEATRPNLDVRVGVAISGTPINPRVRLFSEPEMSEIDKLSWLVMGRASDGLGRTDTALLQRAALALLAGEGGGPTDQLTKAIGLDELSVRQSDGEVRETVISLGKQLSRRWYVGYERGLNATAGNWQLIYRLARRFTLRAQSGQDNSLDVIWTWRWQ
ncbi:MAG TPA: translocation/assembly module TamB domain-containing protein [Burkholderiaceae bacterium]